MLILAKTIKVYSNWSITFKSIAEKSSKLNLVLMGKEIINFQKLKIPKNSSNGIASVLTVDNNYSMVGVDEYLKENSDRLKSEFY